MNDTLTISDRFEGCITGGAIGDAWGSAFENAKDDSPSSIYYLQPTPKSPPVWAISDDTQLTMATCEAIAENNPVTAPMLANKMLKYYQQKRLSGLGASTLKALRELEIGGHWSLVGRSGEYAAGNGAAMRIAPFAFNETYARDAIRDFCRITHKNDEAYAGAFAVVLAMRAIINNTWEEQESLVEIIIPDLPDTKVRDRLIEITKLEASATISDVAMHGKSGYVVHSIPLAIFAASQVNIIGFEAMINELVIAGGDTDTNASIAGQIAGCYLGINSLPVNLLTKLKTLHEYDWIKSIIGKALPAISP
jgi:ADP-ribosyl-[dinitrogen reductase] hydrolase